MRGMFTKHSRLAILVVALGALAAFLGDGAWIDNFNW
jgi:hypothetical protein